MSRLYTSIVAPHHGLLPTFGIDLADTARTAGLSWPGRIPYLVVVVGTVALASTCRLGPTEHAKFGRRRGQSEVEQSLKIVPLVFAVIYISIPAGVNIYFVVSGLVRLAQQELSSVAIRSSASRSRSCGCDPAPPRPRPR